MKKFKGAVASVLLVAMVFSLTGCGVKEIDEKTFKDAIKEVFDCDKSEIDEHERDSGVVDLIIEYDGEDSGKFDVEYTVYEDEDAAKYYFDQYLNTFEFVKKHDGIEGKYSSSSNSILMDAEVEYTYDGDTSDYYGGIYICKNVIIEVSTNTGKDRDKDTVDAFLEEISYPKPGRV